MDKIPYKCGEEFLEDEMYDKIEEKAQKLGANLVCGASYQVISQEHDGYCILYFYGTACLYSKEDDGFLDGFLPWSIVICTGFLALVQTVLFICKWNKNKWKCDENLAN